jgi:uncharacterized protein YqeY
MAQLKQCINEDVKLAMRAKEKDRLVALRMIMAAIKQKEVDERIQLDDTQVLTVLDKMAKQRRDSIEQYQKAGRNDLVKKENFDLDIVQAYLPTPLSDDKISGLIKNAINEAGATSMKDMGKVMSILKPQVQGRTDMGKLSGLVKQQLG